MAFSRTAQASLRENTLNLDFIKFRQQPSSKDLGFLAQLHSWFGMKDKLILYQDSFNKKNEWARWSIINNILKKKGGEKPDFWLANGRQLLGLVWK